MIGKLSFDRRDASFDFATLSVENSWETATEMTDRGMVHAFGSAIAEANGVLGLEVASNIAMIFQSVEPLVQSQSTNPHPGRFFPAHRLELSCIATGSPTHMLAEDQQALFLDKDHVFDKGAIRLFPMAFDMPAAAQVVRAGVAQPVTGAVAQSIAFALQRFFQVFQDMRKQLFQKLLPKTFVKLLKRRMIGTLWKIQKLLDPGIGSYLFFGLPIGPSVIPLQKEQSQKLILPIRFLGKLVRVIANRFLAKLEAYQDPLLIICQLSHGKLLLPELYYPGGAFRLF